MRAIQHRAIACAQSGSPPGVADSAAGAGPSGVPAAGTTPPDTRATSPGAKATGEGSLMPCPVPPPYTSQPCIPVK
jgi:hypothetical protein